MPFGVVVFIGSIGDRIDRVARVAAPQRQAGGAGGVAQPHAPSRAISAVIARGGISWGCLRGFDPTPLSRATVLRCRAAHTNVSGVRFPVRQSTCPLSRARASIGREIPSGQSRVSKRTVARRSRLKRRIVVLLADTDIADSKLRVFVDFTRLHSHLLPS